MSTDTAIELRSIVTQSQADATDPVVNDEKVQEELVADVTKLLNDTSTDDTPGEPEKTPDVKSEEPPKGEGEDEKAEDLSQELQTRVKGAGLSEDLAKRLQQSGQLEETLAAFDRSMIEYVQSKDDSGDSDKSKEADKDEPPPSDHSAEADSVPALDPDVYDEDLVKRDAYQQQRIDSLEAKLEELIEGQQGGFDEWFDGALTDLGVDTADNDKCQSVFKAYGAMCDAFGANANARDKAMVQRAHAAMYPQDVFKQKQQQTVDRLRDASGKFLSKSNSKGGPPPKGATDEQVEEKLVSDVTSYLKEQGVQMSGV